MNKHLLDAIFKWTYDTFGVVVKENQQSIFAARFEKYLLENKIDENSLNISTLSENNSLSRAIVNILTIPESYFFRDASLFLALEKKFLPAIIERKRRTNNKSIHIWSAGCARGEEISSIAILLTLLIPDIKTWDISLVGTDICQKTLQAAKLAEYTELSLRATDDAIKKDYFTQDEHSYKLVDSIKKMVDFKYGNILQPVIYASTIFDIILCRNVFIYLDDDSINKALNNFKKSLADDGMLFLGSSDFVHHHSQNELDLHFEDSVTYLTKPTKKKIEIEIPAPSPSPNLSYTSLQKKRGEKLQKIQKLLDECKFRDALGFIDEELKLLNSNYLLYRYKGEALIGLGDSFSAKEVLEKVIMKNSVDAKSYFLLALLEMRDDKSVALKHLEKAISIRPSFPEAHYHIALLFFGLQHKEQGLRALKDAKKYAQERKDEMSVLGGSGSMSDLLKIIDREIRHYEGELK
ncbi:MAG: hypothetical protein P1U74_06080 [Legionellaceae bacterium]|nr:hypothetical protein [Legionellaceae bacterium]